MPETVVEVENLSKKFCRSLKRSLYYGTVDAGAAMLGRFGSQGDLRTGEFWAVDDVSFTLKRGEALGLIGANGCGKTTLLRLISGIFPPDQGRIAVRGRMASLIAVGAGFHPYMSGGENIYLNGVLLGLTKDEIGRRFDQIVDFAEIGQFIDAPVSAYSSGMRVRLGFAIAINTEPDILLVDEVMSVGDTRFRRKASDAMTRLLRDTGASLILVSHNAFTVRDQCDTALLMANGRPVFFGDVDEAYAAYHRESADTLEVEEDSDFTYFRISSPHGEDMIHAGESFAIEFGLREEILQNVPLPIAVTFFDRESSPLVCLRTDTGKFEARTNNVVEVSELPLVNGTYFVQCKVGSEFYGTSIIRNHKVEIRGGVVMAPHPVSLRMKSSLGTETMPSV